MNVGMNQTKIRLQDNSERLKVYENEDDDDDADDDGDRDILLLRLLVVLC